MANIAFTTYFIDGPADEFNDFYNNVRSAMMQLNCPSTGVNLIGVMELIGLDTDDVDARSNFIFVGAERGDNINFRTETPYFRDEAFEENLLKKYPHLNIYFEEDAMEDGVFRTNDKAEKYFSGVNYALEVEDEGTEYFDTSDELISYFKDRFEVDEVYDITDIKEYISHLNDVDKLRVALIVKQYV